MDEILKDAKCDTVNNQECDTSDTDKTKHICNCKAKFAPNADKTACESSVGKLKTKH